MITVTDLAMQYGNKLLFTDVNLTLNRGKRYGLVGANGAGKSTLFRLLMREEEPSDGEIIAVRDARIGCLSQDQFAFENTLIINTVIAGKKVLWEALQEKEELLALHELDEKSGCRLGELEQIILDNDGYTVETFAEELLIGLGIKEELLYEPLSVLSGGYKLRVLLAQSLFNDPDVLLLDEPTNHLDIESIDWLESYLKDQFKGVLVFISHDVMFLNNVSTNILDIDYGEIRMYTGRYDDFLSEKKQVVEHKLHQTNYLEKKLAKMQAFVDKFKAGTRSRQAASREKQMARMELPDIQRSSRIAPYFHFKQKRPSGKNVLDVRNISKSYDDQLVLDKVKFKVNRGEKVVIIGPNGVGKSTLLKILLNVVTPDTGEFEWGYEVQTSYFSQDHHDLLNESMSVYSWLANQSKTQVISTLRGILGQMLFGKDDITKDILRLSGGEGARLLLANILLEQGNTLILDEPTNHLDIESKEALKQALMKFPGTLMLVTHDRDFAAAIGTRVIALKHKGMVDFKGTFHEYAEVR